MAIHADVSFAVVTTRANDTFTFIGMGQFLLAPRENEPPNMRLFEKATQISSIENIPLQKSYL